MISIITVTFNSYDFCRLLIESIQIYSKYDNEIIVIDNDHRYEPIEGATVYRQSQNVGHGEGLNRGVKHVKYDHILMLDSDCFILKRNWEDWFLEKDSIIAPKGSEAKPIRASCMFMKKDIALKCDFRATPNYKGSRYAKEGEFDTAIKAFHEQMKDVYYMNSIKSRFNTVNGEEYCIDGIPLVYHNWSGSYLEDRQKDFTEDLQEDKKKLFSRIPWKLI